MDIFRTLFFPWIPAVISDESGIDAGWQAMVALGYAVDAMRRCCFAANFYQGETNPESRAWLKNSLDHHGQRVMDAVRWI